VPSAPEYRAGVLRLKGRQVLLEMRPVLYSALDIGPQHRTQPNKPNKPNKPGLPNKPGPVSQVRPARPLVAIALGVFRANPLPRSYIPQVPDTPQGIVTVGIAGERSDPGI
jgi:hypothetical protein